MKYTADYFRKSEGFRQIFDEALRVAKEGTKELQEEFLSGYAKYINEDNPKEAPTYEDALKIAKSNFGYFAGYYDNETYRIINEAYQAVHPVFGCNPFDISPEDAFKKGQEQTVNI